MGHLERMAELRKRKKLTQGQLAEQLGVEQPTVQRWESGKREPDLGQLKALAGALGVEPSELLDTSAVPTGPKIFVKGVVAAGRWAEAIEPPEGEWETFTGRSDVTAKLEHRFGLKVVGDSMNEIYPEGTILDCVSLFGHAEAHAGRNVIIIRQRELDHCFEATCKELVDIEGALWARPRSYNPAHQAFRLDSPGEGILEVRVCALVVGSYRPE